MAVEIRIPAVGESITEVFIGEWYVEEGAWVEADQEIVGLETDKATFDVPAPTSGVISQIVSKSGDTAEIGEVIGYIDDEADPPESKSDETGSAASDSDSKSASAGKPDTKTSSKASSDRPASKGASSHVMPAAQRELHQRGLSADQVTPSGPGGRLLKEDVQNYSGQESGTRDAGSREERTVALSPIRRTIASRLVAAQQNAALLTTFNEIDMSHVKQCRRDYGEAFQEQFGIKLGFMSFFVKAVVDALSRYPQINAELRDDHLVYRNYFDIGVAVGGGKGLVVPVLRNCERMSFSEIELQIREFARKAQQNKITLSELEGGTFTITNGGVYGSLLSTPIVNPPQSGVLGMHGIVDRPVAVDGEVVVRPMMYVALTYDHRVVDGKEAVSFLVRVKEIIENPVRLILEV